MWGSGQSQARTQSDNAMFHDQQHQDSFKIKLGQQVADKMNQNIFGQVIDEYSFDCYLKRIQRANFIGL